MDMCDFCELQKRKIAGTKIHDEAKAEALTLELLAHQKSYQGERALYNSEVEESKLHRKEFGEKSEQVKNVSNISVWIMDNQLRFRIRQINWGDILSPYEKFSSLRHSFCIE